MPKVTTPYTLDEKAQARFKRANTALWQAYSIMDLLVNGTDLSNDDMPTLLSALQGAVELMSNGLNDLPEVDND
ncbi:hypothetical protein [Rodentibacter trehalosifermentans]|uniref:hypothetical protein n=1 Tax=Rodentibacter trehalosifermentans TaxID=1908263 RepID=UPI00098578A9|nr:hypothetical protein [Rodentibacter trehalosifermentans]OOF52361.1 hypothetical protein BKK53_05705 [Rodentibacter trehalosifermentans]